MTLRFAEVIGQAHALRTLNRSVTGGSAAHSYLFEGPPNVGKTTAALAFGAALLCESRGETGGDADPCLECRSCRLVAEGRHPDLRTYRPVISASPTNKPHLWLTAPSHLAHSLLPIDRIRDLREQAALRPTFGSRKVIVIEEADRMTEDSQNCALKTLEEPPGGTVLLLTVSNTHALLPTIISRCQRVPFRTAPVETVRHWLQDQHGVPEGAALYARVAGGRPGLALRLAREDALAAAREGVSEVARAVVAAEPIDAMRLGQRLESLAGEFWIPEEGVPSFEELKSTNLSRAFRSKTAEVVEWLSLWFRDLLLLALGMPRESVTNLDDCDWLAEAADACGDAWARGAVHSTLRARRQLLQNAHARLALDAMFTMIIAGRH